jgi:hypothetical protein
MAAGCIAALATAVTVSCAEKPPVEPPPDTIMSPPPPPPPLPLPPPPPPPGTVATLAGNIATCGGSHDEATGAIVAQQAGVVFALGDNAFPDGTARDYQCYDASWGAFKSRTWAVIGNHEYGTGTADAAFDYFGERAGTRGQGWYSVDVGAWHVMVLNDNEPYVSFAPGSTQYAWLEADLAANRRRCTLALWHAGLFVSSRTDGFTVRPSRRVLWEALWPAGVDLVINAQQHHYERFAPMRPDGTPDSLGIRQFNVGTGGAAVEAPTVMHPHSETAAAVYGVLRLTLRDTSYEWEFLPVTAGYTDAGSGTCR